MMMCCLLVLDSVTSTPQWIRVPVACSSVEHFLPLEFNSPLESIALLTAFDHADTRFTPLSCPVYNILDVWVVHCRHSGGNRVDLWAWVSALSFRGSPQCVLTLIMTCTSHHSFSHALDDRFHEVSICITCECCS